MSYIGISKRFTFEASHHLPDYVGKCAHPHGHSYKLHVQVLFPARPRSPNGIVLDFDVLSAAVKQSVVERYDHQNLNDFIEHPTAEVLVEHFYGLIASDLRQRGVQHAGLQLTLFETENCSVQYPVLPPLASGQEP